MVRINGHDSEYVEKYTNKFVDKGADLVICQHSHCIGCKEIYNDDPYATDYDTIDVSGLSHRDKLIVNALIKAMRRTMKQKDEKISLSLSELTSSNKKKIDEPISTKRISDE